MGIHKITSRIKRKKNYADFKAVDTVDTFIYKYNVNNVVTCNIFRNWAIAQWIFSKNCTFFVQELILNVKFYPTHHCFSCIGWKHDEYWTPPEDPLSILLSAHSRILHTVHHFEISLKIAHPLLSSLPRAL